MRYGGTASPRRGNVAIQIPGRCGSTGDFFVSHAPLAGIQPGRSTPCVDVSPSESNIPTFHRTASTHGVDLLQIAGNCRRRGGSGCRGVSAMDGATEPPWTDSRRPLQPDPPRHPTEYPLLPLTFIQQVQGCKPCPPTPLTPPECCAVPARDTAAWTSPSPPASTPAHARPSPCHPHRVPADASLPHRCARAPAGSAPG